MPLAPGTTLHGRYRILDRLGEGGMGIVFAGEDLQLRRRVAIKTIGEPRQGSGDPNVRGRLVREARTIAALNHPHICAIYDVGESEGQDFLVMELLEGETLQQRLARGPLPVEELFAAGIQIADALAAAHREGVVHRDLKPSNVMLTRSGVKLLDFGIATQRAVVDASSALEATLTAPATIQGTFVGTLPYMAPEQLEGRSVDARTDIFAFGAVLFEMATGRRAFDGTSPAAVLAGLLGETRPRLSRADRSLPRSLDRIVSACLMRDPGQRWQNTEDLLRELRWAGEDLAHPDAGPVSEGRQVRRSIPHAAWAALLLAAIALTWVSATRDRTSLPPANSKPVIVLMDSPLPGRVYDPRTAAAGGTNADDVTDVLSDLPVSIQKENTSAAWHREEQVVGQNPDLIVTHLSCLFDARVTSDETIYGHLFAQAENRLLVFLAYVAARNPRTHFIVYSRTVFEARGGEQQWVRQQEARLPVLKGRLQAFTVPGGTGRATFRDATTGAALRTRVKHVLRLDAE